MVGRVAVNGEVRPVPATLQQIESAMRLGFSHAIVARLHPSEPASRRASAPEDPGALLRDLSEVLEHVLDVSRPNERPSWRAHGGHPVAVASTHPRTAPRRPGREAAGPKAILALAVLATLGVPGGALRFAAPVRVPLGTRPATRRRCRPPSCRSLPRRSRARRRIGRLGPKRSIGRSSSRVWRTDASRPARPWWARARWTATPAAATTWSAAHGNTGKPTFDELRRRRTARRRRRAPPGTQRSPRRPMRESLWARAASRLGLLGAGARMRAGNSDRVAACARHEGLSLAGKRRARAPGPR